MPKIDYCLEFLGGLMIIMKSLLLYVRCLLTLSLVSACQLLELSNPLTTPTVPPSEITPQVKVEDQALKVASNLSANDTIKISGLDKKTSLTYMIYDFKSASSWHC